MRLPLVLATFLLTSCATTDLPIVYKPCKPTTIHNHTSREWPSADEEQRHQDLAVYTKGWGLCMWNNKCLDHLVIRNFNDYTFICKKAGIE